MPAFTQVLQTYINSLYYFGSSIYSLSMGMLMSGLHKPAAADTNVDARRPPHLRNIYNNIAFYFGKCVTSLACLETLYTSFQPVLSKHLQWPQLSSTCVFSMTLQHLSS